MRGSSTGTDPDAVSDDIAGTGCSSLCFILAGVGLSLTAASTLLTYQVLHEQMESLGASVVDHLSSSNCTAITKVLSALSVARSEVVSGEAEDSGTTPAASTAIGVLTPSTWELADFHANGISRTEALSVLKALPSDGMATAPSSTMASQIARAPRTTLADLQSHRCNLGYGLNPMAVRVYRIPAPGRSPGHHDHHHNDQGAHRRKPAGEESSWLAFLYGPWPNKRPDTIAFALVDLNASTMQASGHDHSLNDMFPGGSGALAMRVQVKPAAVLKDALTLHRDMPSLDRADHKLLGLKLVPFANQLLQTQISIDHNRLDRAPRRSSAFVFLIGLLATSAVVLMSRSSQIRMRRLNQVLAAESRTDGLTRVANRRAWDEALMREECRRRRHPGHRYGLLVVDLDGFKQINDGQGHAQGDAILQQAANALKDELRDTDLLARVGGDEFAVLVFQPGGTHGLEELVKRLRDCLQKEGIMASIGAALSETDTSLEQTWSLADQAMYRVKGRPAAAAAPHSTPSPPASTP